MLDSEQNILCPIVLCLGIFCSLSLRFLFFFNAKCKMQEKSSYAYFKIMWGFKEAPHNVSD